ncbi:MAG: diguanylate cyclase [Clostridiales bacterium]|nr:diguanylate cyclase [Clostridiales bacterium]
MLKQLEYADSILRSDPLKAYEMILELSDILETEENKAEALSIETKALLFMSRIQEALVKSEELMTIAEKNNFLKWKTEGCNLLGGVYFEMSNYDKALEYFMKGLTHARTEKDFQSEAKILNNIGDIYNELDVLDEAYNYFQLSLDMAIQYEVISLIGVTQLNIGEVYLKQDKYDQSLDRIKTAISHFSNYEDYVGIGLAHFTLGRVYKVLNDKDKAKSELLLSINIMRRLHERNNLVLAYEIMIELLVEDKLYAEALEYVEDAMDLSKLLSSKRELGDIALYAAQIYEVQEQYSEALVYYKLYAETRSTYEKDIEEEHQKNISAQINIEKAMHEKEIYRLKNVELRKKSEEIQKLYEDLNTINTISQDITSTLDIKKILYLLYENVNKLMDATLFGIYIFNSETEMIGTDLFLEYGKPFTLGDIKLSDENSNGAWVLRNKKAIFSNDYLREYTQYKKDYNVNRTKHDSQSVILVPLMTGEHVVGAITVQSMKKDAYKEYQFNILKALASHIAIAIKNSQESDKLSLEIQRRIKTQHKLEILNEKLSHMSYIDALTNIPNRRSFVDYFTRELSRAKRQHENIALLIIDIDFFKEYNDNYGHVEGDKCLFLVASLLKKALKREIDFVARYGGDEFVAVMTNIDYDGAYLVAEEMTSNISEHAIEHTYSPIEDVISITIGGYSLIPENDISMEHIIHRADNALYKAKDRGRNQIAFWNDIKDNS